MQGRLVLLNGVSSSGKTMLATVFRDQRAEEGDFWLLVGIDDVLSKLPAQWVDLGLRTGVGPRSRDGLWFEAGADGLRLRVGALCRQLLRTYQRSVADAVRSGFNVIVDDVVIDDEMLTDWRRALEGLHPTWVGVRCAPDVAERRERERGDRPVGMASTQHHTIHRGILYAFEIDTGELTPAAALDALQLGLRASFGEADL